MLCILWKRKFDPQNTFTQGGRTMSEQPVNVMIRQHESGQMKAFADVTVMTQCGELTIRGFRVIQKSELAPWVAFPSTSFEKGGQTKYKDLIDTSQTTRRKLVEHLGCHHDVLRSGGGVRGLSHIGSSGRERRTRLHYSRARPTSGSSPRWIGPSAATPGTSSVTLGLS